MKRYISMLLAVFLLLSCMFVQTPKADASAKQEQSRAIAIVFDNSESMYIGDNEEAWCRATYAMEVFASMLNEGDLLQIYPMHPISVGGKEYTQDNPFCITDASQASSIRDIRTVKAGGTPIESIDAAATGLQSVQADKKYIIVLTDGSTFSKNGKGMNEPSTIRELDKRIAAYAGPEMSFMYLGIGSKSCAPQTEQSEYFVKKKAQNSNDVLATLTEMCNQIFGRDSMPEGHLSGKDLEFDISMKKLIVFVQGENIQDLKITKDGGGSVGELISKQQTKYATDGRLDGKSIPDTSLQGMMVTYANCDAGKYTIDCSGTVTNIEVYYEPDADLDFVFTDAAGKTVDPNALYEGNYKVSFGMKDGKTGQLISSDLLGSPVYHGSYFIDDKESPITHEGFSGSVDVPLKMGEKFAANLTVTYLSGYTISKDSSDFGWPEGGIVVAAKPAGELTLEITGGDNPYSLQNLEEGSPFVAKVYYQGEQLTGKELESVDLRWEPETSNAEIRKNFAEDHWELYLLYKDPAAPQDTVCGECTVIIYAYYSAQGSSQSAAECAMTYNIKDDFSPLQIDLFAPETYIKISAMEESEAIVVNLKLNGAPLTARDFAATELKVDCGGIKHTVTPSEEDSAYLIKLLPTEGISKGDYTVKVTANYTDHIGRETSVKDETDITLSRISLLAKWLIIIGAIILLIILIILILRIRRFPRTVRPDFEGCSLRVGGRDVSEDANFYARSSGKQIVVHVEYNAEELGRVSLNKLSPGKESFLSKPSVKRSFLVKYPENVSISGDVTAADVAGIEYKVDKEGRVKPAEEQQAPFSITNGASISINGKTLVAGKSKNFSAEIPLNFKKR